MTPEQALAEMRRKLSLGLIYGPSAEDRAAYEARVIEDGKTTCAPCCGEHDIRFNEQGEFWISLRDDDFPVKFCPNCGKPPTRT